MATCEIEFKERNIREEIDLDVHGLLIMPWRSHNLRSHLGTYASDLKFV